MRIAKALVFLTLILTLTNFANADVPQLLSYQGRLTNTVNEPVADGLYSITFSIYDAESNGTVVWSESLNDVQLTQGLFSVFLGQTIPITSTVFSEPNRYLEVSINDEIVTARHRFSTVSYAYRIETVDGATGGDLEGPLTIIPSASKIGENLLTIQNGNKETIISLSSTDDNSGAISLYEPVDNKSLAIVKRMEINDDNIIMYDKNTKDTSIYISTTDQSEIALYEPVDNKFATSTTRKFEINAKELIMYGGSEYDTNIVMSSTETGSSTISIYEPADTKAGMTTEKKFEMNDKGFVLFGTTTGDTSVVLTRDETGDGSISFYEPADTKSGFAGELLKIIEINNNGMVMFASNAIDTNLYVAPNGDIIGLGQLTMGENSSSGLETSVLGFSNSANGDSSTIGGGSSNITYGAISVIAGGYQNITNALGATISGGSQNDAGGEYSTVSGGSYNLTTGNFATIGGGTLNQAHGDYSTIPGGTQNTTMGFHSYSSGYRAKAMFDGSYVWADNTEADFSSTAPNQYIIRASGGVGIGTDSPTGQLDVSGPASNSTVNLPDSSISTDEIWNEPGIASARQMVDIDFVQGAGIMNDILTVTITIPTNGYIVIRGSSTMMATGTSKKNQITIQIDETSGGLPQGPYFTQCGTGDNDTPSSIHYFSLSTERIYSKTAGTYTFILEGMANSDNGSGAVSRIINSFVTATFMPTAYGSVAQ